MVQSRQIDRRENLDRRRDIKELLDPSHNQISKSFLVISPIMFFVRKR